MEVLCPLFPLLSSSSIFTLFCVFFVAYLSHTVVIFCSFFCCIKHKTKRKHEKKFLQNVNPLKFCLVYIQGVASSRDRYRVLAVPVTYSPTHTHTHTYHIKGDEYVNNNISLERLLMCGFSGSQRSVSPHHPSFD